MVSTNSTLRDDSKGHFQFQSFRGYDLNYIYLLFEEEITKQ